MTTASSNYICNGVLGEALELEGLTFRETNSVPHWNRISKAAKIEALVKFDRLAAALEADTHLANSIKAHKRTPNNPVISDRVVNALGVWAITRCSLHLFLDALIAVETALDWIKPCPGTRLSALTHLRAALIGGQVVARSASKIPSKIDPVLNHQIQTALYHHILALDGDEGVGIVLLETARSHFQSGEHEMARRSAEKALSMLTSRSDLRFDAYCLLVRSHLQEDLVHEAAAIERQAQLEKVGLSAPYQRAALELKAEMNRAKGLHQDCMGLRSQALGIDQVGAEQVLETLLRVSSDQLTSPNADLSGSLQSAVSSLTSRIDDSIWHTSLQQLQRGLMSEAPAVLPQEVAVNLRTILLRHHQQEAGGPLIQPCRDSPNPYSSLLARFSCPESMTLVH